MGILETTIIVLISAEAEQIEACEATMEAIAKRNFNAEVIPQLKGMIQIWIIIKLTFSMETNRTYIRHSRHTEIR